MDSQADVETGAVAAQIAFIGPPAVALHLIVCVEPIALDKAGCQTKSHGSVVGPLTRQEIERASAGHVGEPFEGSPRTKLHRCADCVPSSKAKEAASKSVVLVYSFCPCRLLKKSATLSG